MVQKLLINRGDEHHPYSREIFQDGFSPYFKIIEECRLPNGRSLFLMQNQHPDE